MTYMWNLTYDTNELIYKKDPQTQRTDLWLLSRTKAGEGMDSEVRISRCKLLYIDWIKNKVLLSSTEYCIEYPLINHNGKEYEKECIGRYV